MKQISLEHNLLNRALQFAINYHYDQVDKGGEPYIYHPLRVALMAKQCGLDIEAQCIGLLHDVAEDTNCSLITILFEFNHKIYAGVDAMTRRNGKNAVNGVDETYFQFVNRVSEHPKARKIKLLDNADNMRPERKVPGLKLENRYQKAYTILRNACTKEDEDFLIKFGELVTWI